VASQIHPLLNDRLRVAIEGLVSDYRGKRWNAREFKDMNEFSSHPSAILSDGSYAVFVKLGNAANGLEQFETELTGLRLLSELAEIQVPIPIGNLPVEGVAGMILEGVQTVERTPKQWRQIGQTLAKIHRIKGSQFGLNTHNYFGPLYQDNRPLDDWPTFYAERRLPSAVYGHDV
jgi:protein-ribulosamine 3-kinase